MLKSPIENLRKVNKEGSALGHFNVNNLEMVKAVTEAADELNQPIFVAVTENAIDYAGFDYLVGIIKTAGRLIDTDIFLHLDHGKSLKMIEKTIEGGFTSIMYDGSSLPMEENIAKTKKIKKLIGKKDIALEAEIGHVGRHGDKTEILSSPQEAAEFAQETKVDMLAVAVGTIHGYVKKQNIDYDRLSEIDSQVEIPLVIHGCSGLTEDKIKRLKDKGANKFNIDSEIRLAFMSGLKENINETDPRRALKASMSEIKEVVKEKINVISN